MKQVIVILCVVAGSHLALAQNSTQGTQRRNTIKLDITSHYMYRNALNISYERVTLPNQSFVVTVGYQEFPKATSLGTNVGVKSEATRNGYKYGGEYRFYLKKENKFAAPRGVYLGPYFAFNGFNNERIIEVDNNGTLEQATLDTKLGILNVGFQLGYQFVIKNRFVIDLVFVGPSISHYKYTLALGGNYTFDKEDITNEIILDLIDRFPMLDEAISDGEASDKGKLDTWSFGYRYQLHIGYHFGRRR
ncbi:MAG TPA: hypothetical protein VK589_20895 [Chryseolinea sp.]|nr:hypothetical protein [Chryseolinea sp.]